MPFKLRLLVSLAFLPALAAGFCASCKPKNSHAMPVSVEYYTQQASASVASNETIQLANAAAVQAAFTLDYRPQTAEGGDEAEFLSASDLPGGAAESSGRGTILGGGLRKLSEYKTVYFDPVKEKSRIEAIRAAQEKGGEGQLKAENAGPLTVIDWGPRGNYSSAIQRPSIYVIFSHPMTALASLGEQSSASPIVSINPPIKGSFRWYGTSFLSFEGDEPCQSQQVYTITVAANASSIYGNPISGERVFTFFTETLSIKKISPGEEFRKQTKFQFNNNSVPPEAAKQIGMEFNYPVQAAVINQYLEISNGKTPYKFTLAQESEYKITANLSDPVEFETTVTITLKRGARSQGGSRGTETDQVFTFKTPGAFKVDRHRRSAGYGKYRNLVEIEFSYPLNESTALTALSTEPAMPIGRDNVEVWGDTLRLYNLPIGYGAKFKVLAAPSIEDVYGRTLGKAWSADIVVPNEPPPQGEAQFLDSGHAMLEAQFPPRFLFEYKNIDTNSSYLLVKSDNPWNKSLDESSRIYMTPGKVNNKYFEEINLSPYLNQQGRGFVSFRANLQLLDSVRQQDGTYRTRTVERKNELNIQVTDLGLTVRYGFNKTTVLVTSLSSGKPVEGAKVTLLPPGKVKGGEDVSFITPNLGEAKTNKDGLAVLYISGMALRNNTANNQSWRGYDAPFVLAEKDGDQAIFDPFAQQLAFWHSIRHTPARRRNNIPCVYVFRQGTLQTRRGSYLPGR